METHLVNGLLTLQIKVILENWVSTETTAPYKWKPCVCGCVFPVLPSFLPSFLLPSFFLISKPTPKQRSNNQNTTVSIGTLQQRATCVMSQKRKKNQGWRVKCQKRDALHHWFFLRLEARLSCWDSREDYSYCLTYTFNRLQWNGQLVKEDTTNL